MQQQPAILLVKTEQGKRLIACACPRSSAQGVRTDMTLAHARALITRDRIIEAEHDPAGDAAALRKLAAWAIRFTPLVSPVPPDGLTLDVTGCHRLYQSERRMLNAIGNSLEHMGIANRLCCASTVGCAWALARFSKDERTIVPPGGERAALEPLPIEALRIDDDVAGALHEVNVDHISDVLALPRLELAARFSAALMHRVDQALGDAAEVVDSIHPSEPVSAERVFSGAVSNLEALFIVLRELIEDVAAQLVRQECGAVRLDVTLTRLDATPIHLGCRLSRPSRDVKHLWSLMKPKVESANMGFGVECVRLVVTTAQRIAHQQRGAFAPEEESAQAKPRVAAGRAAWDRASGELIDTLSQRLGPERAVRVQVMASHVPERTAKLTPALTHTSETVSTATHRPVPPKRKALVSSRTQTHDAALVDADRPSQLLRTPELIEVMAVTPDGPPMWVRWRGVEHRIVRAAGPERINCEWWRAGKDGSEGKWRDYFKVQDEAGRWLWIFRAQHTGRWFAHGEWA